MVVVVAVVVGEVDSRLGATVWKDFVCGVVHEVFDEYLLYVLGLLYLMLFELDFGLGTNFNHFNKTSSS